MATTRTARPSDLDKLDMTCRIRERVVRVTAEQLLDALDRGDEPMLAIARRRLTEALIEAQAADEAYLAGQQGSAA